MQFQTLVDLRLRKLWQERLRHARSVISTAADLERVDELTSLEINHLVDLYAAWLVINLTETERISMTNDNAHEAATKMICDVCTQIYQRADQSIIKTYPELAGCAVAGNCVEPTNPNTHKASTALSEQSDPHHFRHIAFSVTSHTGVTRRSTALFLRGLPRTTSPIYAPLYGNKKWDAVPATHNRPARSLPRIQLAERCHF